MPRRFAMGPWPSYTTSMKKTYSIVIALLAGAVIFAGNARAQQSAPAGGQQPPAASQTAPAAKAQTTPAAKTGQSAAAKRPVAPLTLKTDKDKLSYAVGMNIGRSIHSQSME